MPNEGVRGAAVIEEGSSLISNNLLTTGMAVMTIKATQSRKPGLANRIFGRCGGGRELDYGNPKKSCFSFDEANRQNIHRLEGGGRVFRARLAELG